MNSLSSARPSGDERAVRSLVCAIVLRTIKDAAAPRPPRDCTPHDWYLAQLQVVEWIPDYGEEKSGAAYVRKRRQQQCEKSKEKEAMEMKRLWRKNEAELEKEATELQSEQATLEEFLLHVGESGIADIESALIRQKAIEIRLAAIANILEERRAFSAASPHRDGVEQQKARPAHNRKVASASLAPVPI